MVGGAGRARRVGAPKPKPFVPTEAQVLRGVLDYLEHEPRVLCWRQNTGGAKLPGKGGKLQYVRFSVTGAADITGMIRATGRRLEVEVKRPGGEQSDEQREFQIRVELGGAAYLVVTSIADCKLQLDWLCDFEARRAQTWADHDAELLGKVPR